VTKGVRQKQDGWPFTVQLRKDGGPLPAWAQRGSKTSNALDLDAGVFQWDDPRAIAQSLKDAADRSERRKAPAFQSAMSMLTFHINRAGGQLPAGRRAVLQAAKDELRELYGRVRHEAPHPPPGLVERRAPSILS